MLEVHVTQDGLTGRGEAAGVDYADESCASMLRQVEDVAAAIGPDGVLDRTRLQRLLHAGGARNALDCALWDLMAKREGTRAPALVGIPGLPVVTYITIGLDPLDEVAWQAEALGTDAYIKIKLGGADDRDRLRVVREAAPGARLIADANAAWDYRRLITLEDDLLDARVVVVEQPLPVDEDACLHEYRGDLAFCADKSCCDRGTVPALVGRYQYINIKLDKTGGLTEALAVAALAQSLGIAPALIVAQLCELVDRDCPLQLTRDIEHGLIFDGHRITPASRSLWG